MLARCLSLLLPLTVVSAQEGLKKEPGDGKRATSKAEAPAGPRRFTEFPVPEAAEFSVEASTLVAVAALLDLQEGDGGDQWPYEGVYREDNSQLPVGYRVGGTSITCLGLLSAPGYRADERRQAALRRGLEFVLKALETPRMQVDFIGTYDVRGWGHIYALQFLLHLQDQKLVPDDLRDAVAAKTAWLVQALVDSAIPESGGWNYSRRAGYKNPRSQASTFMTAPALQALFHAKARGHAVSAEVVEQALAALERARSQQGGYAYGSPSSPRAEVADDKLSMMDKTPGAAARAAVCEATLMLAGRGDEARLSAAIDLFFAHWDDLAVRKSQTGTHIPPYGIAPYYFLFGHVYCAQAIEFLPRGERRDGLRQKMLQVLARSREADGSWNDRQFGRSAGYGTALALLTMHMPRFGKPPAWRPDAASK
jgi:hypothetical protein